MTLAGTRPPTVDEWEKYELHHRARLAWSSVVLAFENSKRILEEVKKPKALGDIRGISYIYPILWRFGLIRVPEAIEKKMGKQR